MKWKMHSILVLVYSRFVLVYVSCEKLIHFCWNFSWTLAKMFEFIFEASGILIFFRLQRFVVFNFVRLLSGVITQNSTYILIFGIKW